MKETISYPLTIIYLPLRWCGYVYKLIENVMVTNQYYPPGCPPKPKYRLFAQYHAPQTTSMKEEIFEQLHAETFTIRVVLATVAIGMGVDLCSVIHIGPPRSIRECFQESVRAGRDGKLSHVVLCYNNRDIRKNKPGMNDDVHEYYQSKQLCLRVFILLEYLDASQPEPLQPGHLCCSVCENSCLCINCTDK